MPCAPVLRRKDVIRHPQIAANGSLIETDHPVARRLRQARPAPRFSATPTDVRRTAPGLGEHTEEILREVGLDDALIAKLKGK